MAETVAIIGGSGKLGPGLAAALVAAGHTVVIGSRDAQRATVAATEIAASHGLDAGRLHGMSNGEAATRCTSALITLPAVATADTLAPLADALAGKAVISAVVPLEFAPTGPRYSAPPEGSAAQQIQRLLPAARVAATLHTVSSADLRPGHAPDGDALICGDDPEAIALAEQFAAAVVPLRPVVVGGLAEAAVIESLTVLMLLVNRRNRGRHAGVRITGIG